ncbi:MAG: DUF4097 family beta strand repeat-containing protein [Nocardioidaceae bacterium]
MHSFSTPGPVRLRAQLWEGSISVVADETDTTTVDLVPEHGDEAAQDLIDRATVEQQGDEIVISMPKTKGGLFRRGYSVRAVIHLPVDSDVQLETASADIETRGPLADVTITTGSGEVDLELTADLQARLGSGDLRLGAARGSIDVKGGSSDLVIGDVAGRATILTGSGDALLEHVGEQLTLKSGSGDVVLKHAGEDVNAMAGSGDLLLKRVDHGRVKVKTGSGDIAIGVASGTAAHLDVMTVSGEFRSSLDSADAPTDGETTVEIDAKSGSGDVVLQRA